MSGNSDVDPMDRSLAAKLRHTSRMLEKHGLEELAHCVNEAADQILLIKLFRENAFRAGRLQATRELSDTDSYQQGLEDAALVVERWSLPTIQTPSMWLIDKAGIADEIRAARCSHDG